MALTPDHLFTETATITQRSPTGARDSYGNVLVAPVTRTSDCYHEQVPILVRENDVGGQIAEETWNLYLPADDPLSATDAVSIDGKSFEIIGPPWQTWNPRARVNGHVRATMRRTEG